MIRLAALFVPLPVCLTIACLAIACLAIPPGADAEPPAGTDWVPTFADEFDGLALDTRLWTSGRPTGPDDPAPQDARGALLSDGILHLVTRHHPMGVGEWTTASISPRHFRQVHGYVEVRMRFARATGLNNVVMLTTEGSARAARTEIVLVEGRYPNRITVNLNRPGSRSDTNLYSIDTTDFSADYHVYGLSWLPDGRGGTHLIWYFDDYPVHQADCADCGQPMRLWIGTHVTTWAGPFAPVQDGASMDVDYVRIYQDRTLQQR